MDDRSVAFEEGKTARASKTPRESCPYGDYPGRAQRNAWLEGWDAGAPRVQTRPLPVVSREPAVKTPGSSWPKTQPLPAKYARSETSPCPSCKRTLLDSRGNAVECQQLYAGVAHLRCRLCNHQWSLPVA